MHAHFTVMLCKCDVQWLRGDISLTERSYNCSPGAVRNHCAQIAVVCQHIAQSMYLLRKSVCNLNCYSHTL